MKKSLAIIGMALGALLVVIAIIWTVQSAKDSSIVGANIGAGVVGVFGLLMAVVSTANFLDSANRKK